ncbi:hypothetical protein MWH25_11005 [Natroniella acetigena]|uniref:hypothetical protein n=1 Tax=Natroniella acetigena TaxID=52004 RepID=UPI00200A6531|nr:hypothetical protein [Natroniella acetigena]MCK8828261.1 hypothetical protein [Natroniella acetigena]
MKIRLGRQRFWLDPWRFEIWPELLGQLPADMEAVNAKELATKYLDLEMDELGRLANNEELYGLFGVEQVKTDNSYKIRGVKFINNGQLVQEALDLVVAYQEADEREWLTLLAEQVLKYSPRMRAITLVMLEDNPLEFEQGWFSSTYNRTSLKYQGELFYPFNRDHEEKNLNDLLEVLGYKALGPWWLEEIGEPVTDLEWRGSRGENPSLSGVGKLRSPLELFLYLEWLEKYDDQTYYLNQKQFKQDLSLDLLSELTGASPVKDELELLKGLVEENIDFRGYFPVYQVGKKLHSKLDVEEEKDKWIERFFKTKLADNQIRIIEHQSGQPRHGRGLYGKREYQLLKVEFLD